MAPFFARLFFWVAAFNDSALCWIWYCSIVLAWLFLWWRNVLSGGGIQRFRGFYFVFQRYKRLLYHGFFFGWRNPMDPLFLISKTNTV